MLIKFLKILIACVLAPVFAGNLFAETAIKSIDQAGKVTYSDRATPDAVSTTEIEIEAGPSESQVKEAEQRASATMEKADKAQAQRDAQAREREEERKAAAERAAAQEPQTIVIENQSGYPVYSPPAGSRPPVQIPPGDGGSQHPIYTPPGTAPPVARPLPSPRNN